MPRRTASDPASRAAISASTAQALWYGVLGALPPAQVVDRARERSAVLGPAHPRESGDHARRDVADGRVEERAVIRERNLVQVIARVVHVEGGEAAVLALHPDEPVEGATQRKRE